MSVRPMVTVEGGACRGSSFHVPLGNEEKIVLQKSGGPCFRTSVNRGVYIFLFILKYC